MSASCLTRPQTLAEQKTLDTMRNMTRNDVLPSEDAVAAIENQFPEYKGCRARPVLRARIKLNAKDYAGAASLLDARVIRDQTSIYDYALSMRGNAFEQTGKDAEARAVIRSFCTSIQHHFGRVMRLCERQTVRARATRLLPFRCCSRISPVRQPYRSVNGGEGIRTGVGSNPCISFVSTTLFLCTSFRRSG